MNWNIWRELYDSNMHDCDFDILRDVMKRCFIVKQRLTWLTNRVLSGKGTSCLEGVSHEHTSDAAPHKSPFWGDTHYSEVIMSTMASQITSLTIVYSTVYSGADQKKHQSSASLAFVRGIHRWPVNSRHKGPVTRKMFPFDDVIMGSRPSVHAIITQSSMMGLHITNDVVITGMML